MLAIDPDGDSGDQDDESGFEYDGPQRMCCPRFAPETGG